MIAIFLKAHGHCRCCRYWVRSSFVHGLSSRRGNPHLVAMFKRTSCITRYHVNGTTSPSLVLRVLQVGTSQVRIEGPLIEGTNNTLLLHPLRQASTLPSIISNDRYAPRDYSSKGTRARNPRPWILKRPTCPIPRHTDAAVAYP